MASEEGEETYKQRAAASETLNADLQSYYGADADHSTRPAKAKCVALGVHWLTT
jgi:hypothetical protein